MNLFTKLFSKKTSWSNKPKRFENWQEATKYLDEVIVIELVEMPNETGVLEGIRIVYKYDKSIRTVLLRVNGHEYDYWLGRPHITAQNKTFK